MHQFKIDNHQKNDSKPFPGFYSLKGQWCNGLVANLYEVVFREKAHNSD